MANQKGGVGKTTFTVCPAAAAELGAQALAGDLDPPCNATTTLDTPPAATPSPRPWTPPRRRARSSPDRRAPFGRLRTFCSDTAPGALASPAVHVNKL
ncbi:AAA family ATPase [Streptosporangium canum]|uniref:AAA family ATPase n=1 Tax=Streptosporangium canum TaxID=324952 RepID=UPI0036893F69